MNQAELFYDMIFKRKSFHIFKDIGQIESEELTEIEEVFQTLKPDWQHCAVCAECMQYAALDHCGKGARIADFQIQETREKGDHAS